MASGLVKAAPGQGFYVMDEAEQKTYSGKMNNDGTLSDLKFSLIRVEKASRAIKRKCLFGSRSDLRL